MEIVGAGPSGRIVAKDVEVVAVTGSAVAVVPEPVKTAVSGVELGAVVLFRTMQNAASYGGSYFFRTSIMKQKRVQCDDKIA